jgi:3-dehydroquinate synthetase
LIDAEYVDRIRGMLNKLGLPTRLPLPVPVEELLSLMGSDKKTLDASIRLVLPTQQGVSIMDGIDDGAIGLAWTTVGATM